MLLMWEISLCNPDIQTNADIGCVGMDQLQCNGSAWFRRTDTPLAKQEVFASEVLNSV